MKPSELEHLSYSSISSYLACPKAWRYHYLDKVATPTSPELIFGSTFHDTVESVIAGRAPGLGPTILQTWSECWEKRIAAQEVAWCTDTPEQFHNEGIRILGHADVQKAIHNLVCGYDDQGPKIERKVELHVPGVPIPVLGFIDMIDAGGAVVDFKTSGRSWTADRAQSELQPLVYLSALNQARIDVPGWTAKHVVFVKTKTPQVQVFEHRHSPAQALWLFGLIRNVWRGIESGCFFENPTSWKCSAAVCDYWHLCRGKYA